MNYKAVIFPQSCDSFVLLLSSYFVRDGVYDRSIVLPRRYTNLFYAYILALSLNSGYLFLHHNNRYSPQHREIKALSRHHHQLTVTLNT